MKMMTVTLVTMEVMMSFVAKGTMTMLIKPGYSYGN